MKKNKSTSQWNADHKPPIVEQNKKRWNLTCKEKPRILMQRQKLGDSLTVLVHHGHLWKPPLYNAVL